MTENRIDDLMYGEAEETVIDELRRLAKAHPAESRAADVVADKVILGRFRFSPGFGWLEWVGGKWDMDLTAEPRVREVARQFIDQTEREYRAQAAEALARAEDIAATVMGRIVEADKVNPDGTPRDPAELFMANSTDIEKAEREHAVAEAQEAQQQADMWMNLLSAGKIASVTTLCKGMDGVLTRAEAFDAWPDLLNVENGVVDLRDGSLMDHDPDLLLTHMAGGPYLPDATSATWDQALQAVPADTLEWFQVRMGQSMTGHTPEDDALVLVEGGGENGKSAVMSALMRAAGSYGQQVSPRILLSQEGQHPTELMDLRGLRFALLEETPEEGRLDTHQLKQTIGTPRITARRMRKDPVVFETTHSMWVNSNYLPQVDTTDHGTWRRLKAMKFPYRFLKPGVEPEDDMERRGDTTIKTRLAREDDVPAAVLAWLVAGAMRWYANDGRSLPDTRLVLSATDAWRQGSDVGYQFATEYLTLAEGAFITGEEMRREFTAFLEAQGKRAWSAQTINARLGASMEAAGCGPEKNPSKPSKVREGDVASFRPREAVWGGPTVPPTSPTKGDLVRMWRGVRFKTDAERRGDQTGISAVS